MKLKIIYPTWPKLDRQTEFHLPPHGPVVFAAAIPEEVDIIFEDDNVDEIKYDEHVDLVAVSTMLTCQLQGLVLKKTVHHVEDPKIPYRWGRGHLGLCPLHRLQLVQIEG